MTTLTKAELETALQEKEWENRAITAVAEDYYRHLKEARHERDTQAQVAKAYRAAIDYYQEREASRLTAELDGLKRSWLVFLGVWFITGMTAAGWLALRG